MEPTTMYRQSSKENVQEQIRAYKNGQNVSNGSNGTSQKNIFMKEKSTSQNHEPYEGNQADTPGNHLSRKDVEPVNNYSHTHQVSQNSSILNQPIMGTDQTYMATVNIGNNAQRHLSNKSDSHLNQSSSYPAQKTGDISMTNKNRKEDTEGQKKRKLSEKQVSQQDFLKLNTLVKQRKTSNNRNRGDSYIKETQGIPPIEGADKLGSSQNRSQSKGNQRQNQQNTLNQNQQEPMQQKIQPPQFVNGPQFFDQNGYNPFQNNFGASNGFAHIPQMSQTHGFPFNAAAQFMGGQPAPQVHFIARKQQFIAQISPEQLGGDKRPYTANSLNNLTSTAKRSANIYGSGKNPGAPYDNSNAMVFLDGQNYLPYPFGMKGNGKRLNFQIGQTQKNTFSIYGEDQRSKIKDPIKALGSSNGFNSGGYNSDPYNSIMSQGLPATLTNSGKQNKAKTQNRLQGKEKEQLYDETIKMKMLNNQMREEHVKLKTKIKILENELGRKEKTIEDLFNHNHIIQQSQSKHQTNSNQNLLPLAQTAQKYQQETFLVMSLKKQIRELKMEVVRRDEELEVLRKNIKNTRTQEFEQEMQTYQEECVRLRQILEELMKQGSSHPLHQQVLLDKVMDLESQIQQKDMLIQSLEARVSNQNLIEIEKNNQLPGVKSIDNAPNETNPSDGQLMSGSASAQTQGPREKSIDKRGAAVPNNQKDIQKELTKVKKALKEKEKELLKAKQDAMTAKKEQGEKVKQANTASKDTDAQVKTLKDKILLQKGEARRREEKLIETETKMKQLENQLKALNDQIKQHDDQNKQLKAQLRQAKHKQKQGTEASVQVSVSSPEPIETSTSKKSLSPRRPQESVPEKAEEKPTIPKEELSLITLIGQREKLCRDDLTAMMLAGEESLRMLIKEPSTQLLEFIKANIDDEDSLLAGVPRYEIPKNDFERQVLREMKVVLKDNCQKIFEKSKEELMPWTEFEEIYKNLENFEYPHKDKLMEFIKYFFLDHIVNKDLILINFQAFKEHLGAKRAPGQTPDKSRNPSHLRSANRSQESSKSRDGMSAERKPDRLLSHGSDIEDDKGAEEERMLDIAEQCFMRIADFLHIAQRTVRQVFLRYSQPELFKDGSVLELLSPRGFLEGVRDIGFDDITELEAACLMKVLAKPELDNSVILNEFVLIMENFGVPVLAEEDEYENDYIPDSDSEVSKKDENETKKKEEGVLKEGAKDKPEEQQMKFLEKKKQIQKNTIALKFDVLDEKAHKILKKLARFLLERYMHPREFFGPTIKKEVIGKKKCKVEVIKQHDFYLRIKLASIRKKIKENETLNKFLAIDGNKYPGFVQVKRMIKALEIVAEKEQEQMIKEQEEKQKEHKEKIKKMADERAAQGLPTLTEDEMEKLISPPPEEKKVEKKGKDILENKKPSKANIEEVIKLGGKPSKIGEREGKSRFASVNGPGGQLNTIEEDLHETQTSHYSQHIRDEQQSDREGSRHQLSTNLRNSAALNELEDSGQRSTGCRGLPVGQSVHSGDYSEGSLSSNQKKKVKDIEQSDIQITEFKDFKDIRKKRQADPKLMSHDKPQSMGISIGGPGKGDKTDDNPLTAPGRSPMGVISGLSVRNHPTSQIINNDQNLPEEAYGDYRDIENDQEIDKELNKKISQMQSDSFVAEDNKPESEEDENYSEEMEDQDGSNQRPSQLSQPEGSQQDQIANAPDEAEKINVDKQTKHKEGVDGDSEIDEDYEF